MLGRIYLTSRALAVVFEAVPKGVLQWDYRIHARCSRRKLISPCHNSVPTCNKPSVSILLQSPDIALDSCWNSPLILTVHVPSSVLFTPENNTRDCQLLRQCRPSPILSLGSTCTGWTCHRYICRAFHSIRIFYLRSPVWPPRESKE